MESLEYCAKQAVEKCMGVKKGEAVAIIYDESARKIAASISVQVDILEGITDAHCIEEYGHRSDEGVNPLKFPSKIKHALESADVSFFIAGDTKEGERESFRGPMLKVVGSNPKLRHAHMPGITEEAFLSGMSPDYNKLREVTQRVKEYVENAKQIRVMTPAGTDFTAEFGYKWIISDGFITSGKWDNLPGSETFTCPTNLEGRIVVDGVLGDFFDPKYGLLEGSPMFLKARNGRIVSVDCPMNRPLEKDFYEYISKDENANRFGEFAIGTNLGLERLLGNMLHDKKFPGVHVAVGHPYPKETGADWDSNIHCDMVMRECNIYVDGLQIMERGKFAPEIIGLS